MKESKTEILWRYYKASSSNDDNLHFKHQYIVIHIFIYIYIYRVLWVICRRFIFNISRICVFFSCQLGSTIVGLIDHRLSEKQHHDVIRSTTNFDTTCCIVGSTNKNISECLDVNLRIEQRIRKELGESIMVITKVRQLNKLTLFVLIRKKLFYSLVRSRPRLTTILQSQ